MAWLVTECGAVGDGKTDCTPAFQAAIDACARAGGGRVVVPAGTFVCGTLRLGAKVNLHLEAGGRILGSRDAGLYPVIGPTPYGNLPGQIQALIWAEGVEGASITGMGVIDGGGEGALSYEESIPVKFRPALVFCRGCRDLRVQDVSLVYSCFWTLHLLRCEDVRVRGVTIRAQRGRINTDGIDPDGCRNVVISDCIIDTGDDCIVVKSTEGDVCENIAVTNCVLSSACAAIKIGTEGLGPIRNVVVSNCVVTRTEVGLALYMKDGGVYENMMFKGIVIEAESAFPVIVDVTPRYYREPTVGTIRNVLMEGLVVRGRGRLYIEGYKEKPIENLTLRDVVWEITGACDFEKSSKPGGAARGEWDPNRVNHAVLPYHVLARHVEGLVVDGFRIVDGRREKKADRGWMHGVGLRDSRVENVSGPVVKEGLDAVVIGDSEGI